MRFLAALLVGGMILACAGGKGKEEEENPSELPPDGIDQAEVCADYLNCLAAVDPNTLASVQGTYGTEGSCWSDETAAAQCAEACETGLAQMDDAYPDEPACDDGSVTLASDLEGTWNFESEDTDGGCDGFSLKFDTMDLEITPDGEKDFNANGRAEVSINGTWYDFDVEFACSLSGDNFTCDEYVGRFDSYWNFEGVYWGTRIDATLELGMGDGEGGIQCTEALSLVGQPI